MDGRGVTNYDVDKPSYSYTTSTTEFDDELIRRGIVTFEQAMSGKGASSKEASRLNQIRQQQQEGNNSSFDNETNKKNVDDDDSSDFDDESDEDDNDDDDDDDDDEFFRNYRQQRLAEMKQEHQQHANNNHEHNSNHDENNNNQPIFISRNQWMEHVNQSSFRCWVVVTLLCTRDSQVTRTIQEWIESLSAADHNNRDATNEDDANDVAPPGIKFVFIPSTEAIENWPDSKLPTLFFYRHGKLQREWVNIPRDITNSQFVTTLYENCGFKRDTINIQRTTRKQQIRSRRYDDEDEDDEDDDI